MIKCAKCHKEFDHERGMKFCPYCGCKTQKSQTRRARGNGSGTAFRRGDKWQVQVTVGWKVENGKEIAIKRSKTGFATKKQALQYAPKLRCKRQQRKCLNDYWIIWSQDDMSRLSASKQQAYEIAYKKLGSIVYQDINDVTLEALRKVINDKCPTYYTARDCKAVLKKLYALADADGYGNPRLPSYINLPSLQEKQGQHFTEQELSKLWEAYDAGDQFIGYVLIMIYTGMMTGELLGLKKSHVDLDNRQIVGAGMKTKVRKATPISIAEIIVPVLIALMNESKKDKVVVMNRDAFYDRYHESLKKAGVRDIPPYSCRHTTATALAIGQQVAPQVIRKVMRWSTSKMLSRYAHPDASDALDAVNRLKKY